MDELAIKFKHRPGGIVAANIKRFPKQMPQGKAMVQPARLNENAMMRASRALRLVENAAQEPGSMRGRADWLIGWGCASAVYPTHVGAAAGRACLLTADGKGARVANRRHTIWVLAAYNGHWTKSPRKELGHSLVVRFPSRSRWTANLPPAPGRPGGSKHDGERLLCRDEGPARLFVQRLSAPVPTQSDNTVGSNTGVRQPNLEEKLSSPSWRRKPSEEYARVPAPRAAKPDSIKKSVRRHAISDRAVSKGEKN